MEKTEKPWTHALETVPELEAKLTQATLKYEQAKAQVIDTLNENLAVSQTSLGIETAAWNEYQDAYTELMRVSIRLSNTKRRAKTKAATKKTATA